MTPTRRLLAFFAPSMMAAQTRVTCRALAQEPKLEPYSTNDDLAILHLRQPVTEALVERIRQIEGVEEVFNVRKYSLLIERAATLHMGRVAAGDFGGCEAGAGLEDGKQFAAERFILPVNRRREP